MRTETQPKYYKTNLIISKTELGRFPQNKNLPDDISEGSYDKMSDAFGPFSGQQLMDETKLRHSNSCPRLKLMKDQLEDHLVDQKKYSLTFSVETIPSSVVNETFEESDDQFIFLPKLDALSDKYEDTLFEKQPIHEISSLFSIVEEEETIDEKREGNLIRNSLGTPRGDELDAEFLQTMRSSSHCSQLESIKEIEEFSTEEYKYFNCN